MMLSPQEFSDVLRQASDPDAPVIVDAFAPADDLRAAAWRYADEQMPDGPYVEREAIAVALLIGDRTRHPYRARDRGIHMSLWTVWTDELKPLIGARLVEFWQEEYRGEGDYWTNDEPLYLRFDDGAILVIQAAGWHDSGSLGYEVIPQQPPPCVHNHRTDRAVAACEKTRRRLWLKERAVAEDARARTEITP